MENDIRILVVDDEPDIRGLLKAALTQEGFSRITLAASGEEAVSACATCVPDVVILDVMLPGIDGFETCKRIREITQCPIIFLSAKSDEVDRILGLAIGGDDYVAKPFSPKEVAYRVKVQARRLGMGGLAGHSVIAAGPVTVDEDACTVSVGQNEVELTAREFEIVRYLVRNAGRVLSRDRLYEAVWGEDSFGCDNTVMVHIRHIREKIEDDPADPRLLLTVKGLGYKFVTGGEEAPS